MAFSGAQRIPKNQKPGSFARGARKVVFRTCFFYFFEKDAPLSKK